MSWGGVVLGAALLRCSTPYSEGDPSTVDAASAGAADGARDGGGGAPKDGGSVSTVKDAALRPGEIACGSTTIVCNATQAACCLSVSGSNGPAVRSFGSTSATCIAIDAGTCGSYVSVGDDFTYKLPQRCQEGSDCAASEVCCALPLVPGGDRFAKEIGSIVCLARSECDTRGRTLCGGRDDCSPTENCLPETDPVLSHVYPTLCR